jgi:nucleotide-binding universal stress UspA family protein
MIPNERGDRRFATLMVCMRVGHSNAALLAVTRDVATRFGSTVVGMAAKQVSAPLTQIRGAGLCESQQHGPRKFAEKAAAAEQEFRSALAGVESLEWRTQMTVGPVHNHLANEARLADLVIAPIDQERFFSSSGQAEIGDLLKSLGRPVLATPPAATGLGFDRALVLWKETRESRRAVADALPLLKEMRRVNVVEIVEAAEVELSRRRLADVGSWLARHGVEADCTSEISSGPPCARLAALAEYLQTDLVVAGAYSHSRLHEWAFGDTRGLLSRVRRCVLASH